MRVLGIDIGGTFTDLVLLDPENRSLHTEKLLTTPEDPVRAVLEGARALVTRVGGAPPRRVVHGTTLVANAVVERKGAVTALLTTRGFRDVLEIRREGRYDLYDLDLEFPEPLVPRRRRFEVDERVDETGRVVEALVWERGLLAGGEEVESWAVCFLHAYANSEHEREVGARLREAFPGVPVSLSSEVVPEIREYERTSTVVANAYVRPVAEGYLERLGAGLGDVVGEEAALHIMLSDGGLTSPETAARFPIRIVESGPAGGVLAAARLGAALGAGPLVSLDMGGTTAKIAFLDAEGPRTSSSFEIDRRHFYQKGSGLPLLVPALDLVEIGAGGGSLAGRGPLGTLVVGPESAGADPGPACYGRSGLRATVTDADLVLGLLDPGYFLGGAMALDCEAAKAALARDVAEPLGLDPLRAAHGVHELVGSNMAEAARVHAAERGLDLASHTLVAFGGAGPVHAWSVAHQLRIPRVLFPAHAGVESALGFLAAPPAFEIARSGTARVDSLDVESASGLLAELAGTAREVVETAGTGPVVVRASCDMRYRGQGAEVRVDLPGLEVDVDLLRGAFRARYRNLYGREVEGVPVEVVTWRVRAARPAPAVPVFDRAGDAVMRRSAPAPDGSRRAWLPGFAEPAEVPVWRRERLEPGMELTGPALVEEAQSTLVMGEGTARVLPGGAVLAEMAEAPGDAEGAR
jgi:N-methylhydantoinase A